MEMISVEIGFVAILVAVLIGPLTVKKIERNPEAFLFLMGACAVTISRAWHISIMEAAQEPLVIGIVLLVLVAGSIIRHQRSHFDRKAKSLLLEGLTLKVLFFELVVVLGLLAAIITPMLPLFVLVEAVSLLPLDRRTRAILILSAGISISLGATLALAGEPHSTIAFTRMQGGHPSEGFLFLSSLQSLYLLLCILALGLISMLFAARMADRGERFCSDGKVNLKNAAIWGARGCMLAGALFLIGVAFGLSF